MDLGCGVTAGAGKKGCLPSNTYTHLDPVPRTPGWGEGEAARAWGHNFRSKW